MKVRNALNAAGVIVLFLTAVGALDAGISPGTYLGAIIGLVLLVAGTPRFRH